MAGLGLGIALSATASGNCGYFLGAAAGIVIGRTSILFYPLLSACGIGTISGLAAFLAPCLWGDERKSGWRKSISFNENGCMIMLASANIVCGLGSFACGLVTTNIWRVVLRYFLSVQ